MKQEVLKVSVRQNAIYIPDEYITATTKEINQTTSVLVANASKLGFTFSESLFRAINNANPRLKLQILEVLKEITGVNKNWTPLVKGWDIPTGEGLVDHLITAFSNVFKKKSGTTLACGHTIPEGTFPLERYNGCPFCGTPFEQGEIEYTHQGSKLKVLELWTYEEILKFYSDLLQSKTPLDATQVESLKALLKEFPLPNDIVIGMKETLMLVIDVLTAEGKEDEVQQFFKNPNDILRYLWYKHTGFLQIIEPKTIINRKAKNDRHVYHLSDNSATAKLKAASELKLKYSRSECKRAATWLNSLQIPADKACEMMHPKRGMWVRFIRALRLAEYSKRKGFEYLAELLDVFYNEVYDVWQGKVNHFRLRSDAENTFKLLKQRPGLFARSLFSNMLWFGTDVTLKHFSEIIDKIPARLVFTLNMYAKTYFDKSANRSVKPLGGVNKRIPTNKLLELYTDKDIAYMQSKIEDVCLDVMLERFSKQENENKTIYIEPSLYNMPVAIGDRSETVQDLPSALMGTRFPLEGNTVRLFLQWGQGLKAQHLDMDLSCMVAYENATERCSYSQLTIKGCKHSGDIQKIPEMVGTAEYIDVNVNELALLGAKYVTFTCNAYSNGSLSPNLVVGWMDSKYPMRISSRTGVAYDPSCVQHQIRITQGNTKGLVFGVLDIENREIVWLEMAFNGQVVQSLDTRGVETLLDKLNSKLNVGSLLALKAEAQELTLVTEATEADEVYDTNWAMNAAGVTQLFLD
ncbi:hypothetical protein [Tenacibaculum sp. M341]|uniref:hypothetical protein n=1 Tax=Tenacibaculum sp. M341 TaxID=2530339 RepID=UPI001A9FDD9D|nr:hypothetical protein [Tenacibaculum sp. M341]